MRLTISTTLFALLLFACGDASYAPEMAQASAKEQADFDGVPEAERVEESAEFSAAPSTAPPGTPPRIIYTAAARGRVANLDSALVALTRRVTAAGGYVSSQHRTNSNWEHAASLSIRLPAEQLAGTLEFLPALTEEIDYQNLDSRDVTAEWLDLEARLQTKRDVRDRYVDILRNRAQKVEDILNAEDKIRVITEEIEAKEGRLRYLRDQVSLSTLSLELYETREYRPVGPVTTRSFGSELLGALGTGWELVRDLLLLLVAGWPLVLILAGAGWWWRRRRA